MLPPSINTLLHLLHFIKLSLSYNISLYLISSAKFVALLEMEADCGLSELHIMVVDDSDLNRKVVERMLKKICCCKVTVAESGMRALEYLGLDAAGEESKSPDELKEVDLVITDYDMPGMTGLELLKKIKGSWKLREIPVVIMSSENIKDRVDRCMEEGAQRFLVKPVKISDVQSLKYFILNHKSITSASTACCDEETKGKNEKLGGESYDFEVTECSESTKQGEEMFGSENIGPDLVMD